MRSNYYATSRGNSWFASHDGGGATYKMFCSKRRALRLADKLAIEYGQAEVVKDKPYPDGTRLILKITTTESKTDAQQEARGE